MLEQLATFCIRHISDMSCFTYEMASLCRRVLPISPSRMDRATQPLGGDIDDHREPVGWQTWKERCVRDAFHHLSSSSRVLGKLIQLLHGAWDHMQGSST